VLYLFSGAEHAESVASYLAVLGIGCLMVDIKSAPSQDLLDDRLWEGILAGLRDGLYQGVLMSPPCGTYSSLREHRPGPRILRSFVHPLGFPRGSSPEPLSVADREQLRVANILTLRAIEAFNLCVDLGVPALLENPRPIEDKPSIFVVPRMLELLARDGVEVEDMDQCALEAPTTKPTRWVLYKFASGSFSGFRCTHEPSWHWWRDLRGVWKSQWSAHKGMHQRKVDGEWASSRSAAYPPRLNATIADLFQGAMALCSGGAPASGTA
jgi:hypothetical protein